MYENQRNSTGKPQFWRLPGAPNRPKSAQDGPKTAPRRPKTAPRRPKMPPRRPKMPPRRPKTPSRWPKTAPRGTRTQIWAMLEPFLGVGGRKPAFLLGFGGPGGKFREDSAPMSVFGPVGEGRGGGRWEHGTLSHSLTLPTRGAGGFCPGSNESNMCLRFLRWPGVPNLKKFHGDWRGQFTKTRNFEISGRFGAPRAPRDPPGGPPPPPKILKKKLIFLKK